MSDARRAAWLAPWSGAGLGALLYFAAFPPLDLGPLAFVALAPLFLAVRGVSRGRAFLLGCFAGTVAISALVSASIYEAAARYFGAGGLSLALFALVVPQIHGALYFGVFALLAQGWERMAPLRAALLLAAAWTSCELARSVIGYGSPWVLLGHSQYARTWLAQSADLGGVFAVSFAVALVNAALALLVDARGRRGARALAPALLAAVALVAVVLAYGAAAARRWDPANLARDRLGVTLVQPDLPLHGRASPTSMPASLRRLRELTRLGEREAALVIWPENAVGFSLAANPSLLAEAASDLPEGAHLLLGAPRAVGAEGSAVFRNSAFLVDRSGAVVGVYDKLRLTPFAETTPWAVVPFLQRRFAAADVYTPGDRLEILSVAGVRFAVLICYEAIYPDLAGEAVRAGAELLVNISNDDWFGGRAALQQHLHAALFRAIETRRYLVRATNSGLSAIIDPRGVIAARVPPDVATTLTANVIPVTDLTVYVRFGDVFAWACVGAVMLLRIIR